MSLIRRYAAPAAVLSAMLGAFAAPYMIPESPDSAVFNSGILAALLFVGCLQPVYVALKRAGLRTLVCGLFWGLLFAAALSLGAELAYYDRLLPGMGALLRRTAVPVMTAPLLGGLCARAMMAPSIARARPSRIPLWGFAAAILVCWLPLLAAYFPGMLNYDFLGEYTQHTTGVYTNLHPLLHSALVNGVVALGEALQSATLGVLIMSLLQMSLFALALGHACAFAQRRGAPLPALLAMTALFALHPVFSVMSLSMTKDTLFAAAVLTLSLMTWEIIRSPQLFFASRRRVALYILCAVGTALLRSNGAAALVLLLPAMIVSLRAMRRRAAALAGACVLAAALVSAALSALLSPADMPSFQLYSLPAQQLVRAYNTGVMTDAQRAALEGWYTSPDGLALHPHLADPAKGYLDRDRLEREGSDFLALWREAGRENAGVYAEAFLMLNIGSWYPDDLSHSTIYPDVSWNDKGYLQTQEYDMTEQGIRTRCFLPRVKDLYERICRRNEYQDLPVVAVLFCPAAPLWALLFACAALVARRQTRYLPAALGALGLFVSYLFGPCTLPRYALPLFCLAPVLLTAALCFPTDHERS